MKSYVAMLLSLATTLSGCAEMTHLTRRVPNKDRETVFIDAKQRAIFYTEDAKKRPITCAEPSPDALSALAAQNALNLATPQGTSIGSAFSIAESAGSIGLRTQSIQLMRDHMFRLCEAYQSGAIDSITFALLHRRFQTTMVGILAIEQLTGAVRAPAIVLGGSASSGDADGIIKLSASRDTMAASVTQSEALVTTSKTEETEAIAQRDAAQKAFDTTTPDSPERATAKTKLNTAVENAVKATKNREEAEGTLASRKLTLASLDRRLTLAQSSGSASSTGSIESSGWKPEDMSAVASAVEMIVKETMELQNSSDLCAIIVANAVSSTAVTIIPESPILEGCVKQIGLNYPEIKQRLQNMIDKQAK